MSDETFDGAAPAPYWDLDRYRVRHDPDGTRDRIELARKDIRPNYAADGWDLFWKSLRMFFLTIVTLGIYRFWMITKLRRHYWSGIYLKGDPLEYTGSGIEKLLGFLLAVVILAVYLGSLQLLLTYAGFALSFSDGVEAQILLNLSVLATLPLFFFARYRGMRYLMSRTRWRGIRFGMEGGAWGYMFRACLLGLLTVVTLGLAYPYMHFKLAKYMTDRTWFGDQRFEQEGSWTELLASWIWLYILMVFIGMALWTFQGNWAQADTFGYIIGGIIYLVSLCALCLTFFRYRFHAYKTLWSNRRLGDEIFFDSALGVGNCVNVYVSGLMIISLAMVALFTAAGLALAWIAAQTGSGIDPQALLGDVAIFADELANFLTAAPVMIGIALTYLAALILHFALAQVFLTHRILRRQVDTLTVENANALAYSRQREHDAAAEAGGFADALGVDIGAGV